MNGLEGIEVVHGWSSDQIRAAWAADLVLTGKGQRLHVVKDRHGPAPRGIGLKEVRAYADKHGRHKIVIMKP